MLEIVPKIPPESLAPLEAKPDRKSYEVYRTPELDEALTKVTDLLPEKDRPAGYDKLIQTLDIIAAQALIDFIKLENPATEPAAHLVIQNLELFAAGKLERKNVMSTATLDYLEENYPQALLKPDSVIPAEARFKPAAEQAPLAPNVVDARTRFTPQVKSDELQEAV